ncbi:putative transport protein YhhT [bioreactor metagenome]|uniref:Putative transport protein YhhT n=1 Tax=bioreactor metagenome TaxID=1076179 RepID=A0A644V083_9ZZZZ|nr:AI-2E family transporter [Negativicutes bacterium]
MIVAKRLVRVTIILLIVLLSSYFLWLVRSGLYPFIIALFLAYLLNPAVAHVEQKGFKRIWAIIIIYSLVFGVLAFGGIKLVPLLIKELENFAREIPQITNIGQQFLENFQAQYQNSALPFSLRIAFDKALLSVETEVQAFTAAIVDGIINSISYFIGIIISPVLAFYLLHDWNEIKEKLLLFLPGKWRYEVITVVRDIDKVLNGLIRGQLLIALLVGILVSTGLYLLNVKFALLIGILAGILDIIPYFGAIIGATPAVTLALLDSPFLALKVIVLFLVIHQLEGTVIGPKILGESVGLHPLSVIFFVFVGGELGGLPGMLLGVPLAAIIKVVFRHLYKLLV